MPAELRTQGMGLFIILGRLLGKIPGPIISGTLIDRFSWALYSSRPNECVVLIPIYCSVNIVIFRTCSLWQTNEGERGSCLLYNRKQLMLTWFSCHVVYKSLGLLCWGGAIVTYKPAVDSVMNCYYQLFANNTIF